MALSTTKLTGLRIQISDGLSVCLWPNCKAQPCFGLIKDEYIYAHDGRRILKRKHEIYFEPGEFQALAGVYQLRRGAIVVKVLAPKIRFTQTITVRLKTVTTHHIRHTLAAPCRQLLFCLN